MENTEVKQTAEEVPNSNEAATLPENGKQQVEVASADAADEKETLVTQTAPAPKAPKPKVHKTDFKEDIVYLYQFGRTGTIASPSPFCLKLETWLRMTGIKYENVDHKMKYRSKRGQLPFVEFNGTEIADSSAIIKQLGTHFNADIDAKLTSEQRNLTHAIITMAENHLHWINVWWRMNHTEHVLSGYKMDLQRMLGSKLPLGCLKIYYGYWYKRKCEKKVRGTGIGAHTAEQIIQMGMDDLRVMSDMLQDKPFYFGDEPTMLDIVVFSQVAQLVVLEKEAAHPLQAWILENGKNLLTHFERMKDRFFPDWQEMCTTLDMNTHIPKPVTEEPQKEEEEKEKEKEKEETKEGKEEKEEKEVKEEKADDEKEKIETDEKKPASVGAEH